MVLGLQSYEHNVPFATAFFSKAQEPGGIFIVFLAAWLVVPDKLDNTATAPINSITFETEITRMCVSLSSELASRRPKPDKGTRGECQILSGSGRPRRENGCIKFHQRSREDLLKADFRFTPKVDIIAPRDHNIMFRRLPLIADHR
jgi:hypothetical protein